MLHTREKQTRRFAALSEHQHASTRLGVQCMNASLLGVWPDHACPSLGQGQRINLLHTHEKQTRRLAALSEHLHASTRLGVQCMNALTLCVWPDHACLSLWARGLLSAQAGCDATHTWQFLEQ